MKLKKKSGLMGAVIALSAASLVSVGFASWVISQGDTQNVTGTIEVDTVENKSHLIRTFAEGSTTPAKSFTVDYGKNAKNADANSIVYGWDDTNLSASATGNKLWLTNTAPEKVENLDATVTFYVSNLGADDASKLSGVLTLTGDEAKQEKYELAADSSHKYIAGLPTIETADFAVSSTETIAADDGLTYRKVVLTIEFEWGEYFGNPAVNPYLFFNDGTKTASAEKSEGLTWAEEAYNVLKAINDFSGVGFNLEISVIA